MRPEAYTVSYDRINYQAPIPQGHDVGAILKAREEGIKDNLLRYLGEYRLGVKFDEFFYQIEKDPLTSEEHLAKGGPGPIRDKFRRAIKAREEKGLSVRREAAECLGFEKLEQYAINAPDKTLFAWVSPPGPREDGYGNYSFTFVGQVVKDHNGRKVRVIPYRNILSKEEHRNYLSRLSPRAETLASDIDFLANPIIFSPQVGLSSPEDILQFIGEHEKINTEWFDKLAQAVGPLIYGYIRLVGQGASDEQLTQARYALENYTIAIKDNLTSNVVNEGPVDIIFQQWGRNAPPPVGGSCGSSDKDNSTLKDYHNSDNKPWDYHLGDCKVCSTKNTWVGPCNICKDCERKFDNDTDKLS